MTQEDSDFIQSLSFSKVYFDETLEGNMCKQLKDKLSVVNVSLYYKLSKLFNLSTLKDVFFRYMERCFLMVAETRNFLELDFPLVKNILYSSELHITSELEVCSVADEWISYNTEVRSKFAKHLLLTLRLSLLSEPALNYVLSKMSSLCKLDECRAIINNVLLDRESFIKKQSNDNITSRYCNQSLFNILVCENSKEGRNLKQIDYEDVNSTKTYDTIENKDKLYKAVCLKGDVYIFVTNSNAVIIKKFSKPLNIWEDVLKLDYRESFCVCVLMNSIYVIGGEDDWPDTDPCFQYDTKEQKLNEISPMYTSRFEAACTVYDGNIVVSGGLFYVFQSVVSSNGSVEVYDHVADTWSQMPEMLAWRRRNHSMVAIKSKLFVIGKYDETCEVFDKISNKFTAIENSRFWFPNLNSGPFGVYTEVAATSIGNEIVVFGRGDKESTIYYYDTNKNQWVYQEDWKHLKGHQYNSCCKIPQV